MPDRLRVRQAMSDAGRRMPPRQARDRLWNVVTALAILLVLNGGLTIGSWNAANAAQETALKNRGATCTVAKAMGIDPLPELCVEKTVRPFFSPNQPVSGATADQADRNLKAYCGLYAALGVADRKPFVCRDVE